MPKTPLRSYQTRIISDLEDGNGIVVLPTGSGKTLIGAAVAEVCLQRSPTKKVLLLVPTCLLVEQQASTLRYELDVQVAEFNGNKSKPSKPHAILVSTPVSFQSLCMTEPEQYGIHQFSLIVFDEVHHVVKKHPYRTISRLIALTAQQQRPRILGLTASISYAIGQEKILHSIQDLRDELKIDKIVTAEFQELKSGGYAGNSHEDETVVAAEMSSSTAFPATDQFKVHQIREHFFHAIANNYAHELTLHLIRVVKVVESDINSNFESPFTMKGKNGKVSNWGPLAHKQAKSAGHASNLYHVLEHLYEAARLIVNSRQCDLELAFRYIDMVMDTFRLQCHPKSKQALMELQEHWQNYKDSFGRFERFKQALLEHVAKKETFRGIVFVQQRVSTHVLEHYVSTEPELKGIFSPGVIYATSTPATATFRVTPTESKRALEQFGTGQVNLLISTAVSEEGLDVPAANVVLRFDAIQTPVSLVQSRGRARQKDSSFVVLSNNEKQSFQVMQNAQHHQASLLATAATNNPNNKAAEKRRQEVYQNRLRNATEFLSSKMNSPMIQSSAYAILNTFATKIGAEVQSDLRKVNQQWQCSLTLLTASTSSPGDVKSAQSVDVTKKNAKQKAAIQLLQKNLN